MGTLFGVTVVVTVAFLLLQYFQLVDAEAFFVFAATGFTLFVAILETMVAVVLTGTTR